MILHEVKLLVCEFSLLFQNFMRDKLFSYIEEEPCKHKILTINAREVHPFCHQSTENGEMHAMVNVVVSLLVHTVNHGDGSRPLLVKVAQARTRHDRLKDVHVELPRERGICEELFHFAIDEFVVLFIFGIYEGIALRQHRNVKERLFFLGGTLHLCRLFLLHGTQNTVLIDIN